MANTEERGRIGRVCWDVSPFTGQVEHWTLAWYVRPLRKLGAFGDFLIDWKLGVDLGHGIVTSFNFSRSTYGWCRDGY